MNVSGTRCICKQNFGSHRVSFLYFILEMGVLVSLDISERVSKVPKKEYLGEGKGRDGGICSESRVGNNSRSPLRWLKDGERPTEQVSPKHFSSLLEAMLKQEISVESRNQAVPGGSWNVPLVFCAWKLGNSIFSSFSSVGGEFLCT